MTPANTNGTRCLRTAVCLKKRVRRAALGLVLAAMLMPAFMVRGADTPVTPNAAPEVRAVLAYFSDIYGKKIISGQQEGRPGTNNLCAELNYLTNTTGRLPALLAMDFFPYTDTSPRRDTQHRLAKHAIDWYRDRHGLVEFCWHWRAPLDGNEIYAKDTKFDLARAVTAGTPENEALVRDLDKIAAELEVLRDAHVPVLWRPLHEANGRWFWWGAHGPEPFRKLWRLMFEDFSAQHRLTNLVWVFSPGAETDLADWYPGDAYVDIIAQDHYPMDGNHGTAKDIFDELTAFARGQKLIALGENGPLPDLTRLFPEKAGWLFFTTWSGNILTEKTTPEQLREWYNQPCVVNLGDLPDFNNYPFPVPGPAVKLAFASAPGDVAVNGVRRSPVTVAVQDEAGRTIRTGNVAVTLSLGDSCPGSALSGARTVTAVNGIATFPDLTIDKAGDHNTLVARAKGLRDAVSPAFRVGPGAGITRAWWTNLKNSNPAKPSLPVGPPAGREILGKAFETPMQVATNFVARYQGYLIPPLTGPYKFWIANECVSELWLSPDATPAKKVKIGGVTRETPYVKWPHTHEAESATVNLEAGRRYYLEVLQEQPAGSIQLAVRWQLPDGTEERPIPGCRLAPLNEENFQPQDNSTTTAQAQ
jgi:mannan endo-1,4-beta-mannosidase